MIERLRFEPLVERHAQLLFDELGDPRLYAYMPRGSTALAEPSWPRAMRGSPPAPTEGGEIWRNWVMFDAGRPIGTLQASIFADHRAMIAYLVLPRHWRQGYAAEGVRWMLREIVERDGGELAEALSTRAIRPRLRWYSGWALRRAQRSTTPTRSRARSSDEHLYERRLDPSACLTRCRNSFYYAANGCE